MYYDKYKKLGRHDLENLLEKQKKYIGQDRILKFLKVKDVPSPERSGRNAGFDFFVPNDNRFYQALRSGEHISIPSGVKVKIPHGYCLIGFNKSGLSVKYGIQVGACVIDENYTGEISLHILNYGPDDFVIKPGMKIMQFVLIKVNYAMVQECQSESEMYSTEDYEERGEKGFGSTGLKPEE